MGMNCSECKLSNDKVSGKQAQALNSVHNKNMHGSANGPSKITK
jgi:hypothetical protein